MTFYCNSLLWAGVSCLIASKCFSMDRRCGKAQQSLAAAASLTIVPVNRLPLYTYLLDTNTFISGQGTRNAILADKMPDQQL